MTRRLIRQSRPGTWLSGAMVSLGFIGLAAGGAVAAVSKYTPSKPDTARQTAVSAAYGICP